MGRRKHWLACFGVLLSLAGLPAPGAPNTGGAPSALLLEVVADRQILSSAIPALQSGRHVLLPLGELCGLLTLAVTVQPEAGKASGFVVREERSFALDIAHGEVTWEGRTEAFDRTLASVEADDIYVASSLVSRWFPVGVEIDFSSLTLHVSPREKLPFQLRRDRERLAGRLAQRGDYADPGYPRMPTPYRMLDVPVADQTWSTNLHRGKGRSTSAMNYAGYFTADLAGMESAFFVTAASRQQPRLRYTLGRKDPDGGMLGPLGARSLAFGNVPVPSVNNILRGGSGEGTTLSNRHLAQPTTFDRHSFQGDLPSGWDVELFYNDALVATQQSRPDGRYEFDDQPLMYGRNDFRLVFHGPLGQTRVERQSFSLDQSQRRPGEFFYDLAEHRDQNGATRSVGRFDWGVAPGLTATGGFVRQSAGRVERRYVDLGLRTFGPSMIFNANVAADQDGGSLAEAQVMTRVGGFGLDASRVRVRRFASDFFTASMIGRDKLRFAGTVDVEPLPRIPLTLEFQRDRHESGAQTLQGSASVSAFRSGTWITNRLNWIAAGGTRSAGGTLLLGRRLAGIGLSGQLGYALDPQARVTDVSMLANKRLEGGHTIVAGLSHALASGETVVSASVNKGVGSYGFGLSASYSSRTGMSLGVVLFTSMVRDPRRSTWSFDGAPKANAGIASARVFVDGNANGAFDPGEQLVNGAGFTVNGGSVTRERTDEHGVALLGALPASNHVDLVLATETLAEPEWTPMNKGVRIVPRAGRVVEVDFPVVMASEVDGTAYLAEGNGRRGVGDVPIELLDRDEAVVKKTKTSWDGYYTLTGIRPGQYTLRVSPAMLQRLRLQEVPQRRIEVAGDGRFIDGMDFVMSREAVRDAGR